MDKINNKKGCNLQLSLQCQKKKKVIVNHKLEFSNKN